MKKKGFTLIELLAVIVILGILATITVPTIVGVINNSKKDTLEEQKNRIINAADNWGTDNFRKLPKTSCDIKIDFLKKEGYLDGKKDILDPTTNKPMTGCVRITFNNNKNQYNYQYVENCSTLCE